MSNEGIVDGTGGPGAEMTAGTVPAPAPLGGRFKAFFLDYAVVSAYLVCLLVLGLAVNLSVGSASASTPPRPVMELIAFGTTVLPVMLYFALQEGGAQQATFGKRRLGIRVTTREGGRVSMGRAVVRNGLKLLPWQIAHSSLLHIPGWPFGSEGPQGLALAGLIVAWGLAGLYFVVPFTARCRRTPYDRLSGTVVTDAP